MPETNIREQAWHLLSDLFVDTTYTDDDLMRLATALSALGLSSSELSYILRKEVGPIAGRWMCYPGAIGPWPMFEEGELALRINDNLRKPWYKRRRRCLLAIISTWRSWRTLKSFLREHETDRSER